jgi:hypothetical protein
MRLRAAAIRGGVGLLAVAAAVPAILATSASAGPAGHWTQITHAHSGAKANLGLARGKDGTLHVLWAGAGRPPFKAILDTPISPAGKIGQAKAVVSGWNSVQPPAAVAGPDGSVHVLISGQKVLSNSDPYAGLNEAVGPGSWSLGQHAFGNYQLTVSSAADVSTAMQKSGALVSAWRSAVTMLFQRGVNPATQPQVITPANDLVELPAIAADQASGDVIVAFDSVRSGSVFFRRVLPSLDAPRAMPQAKAAAPSLAARIGGGVYSAYSPDHAKVWLLRFGGQPKSVPVPKGVQVLTAGLAAGPQGRLWVFYGNAQQTFVTRTSKAVSGFEPVQAFKSPPGTIQYFRLEGEGSAGPLDLFADVTIDGAMKDGSYGTHILPELSLAVAKKALKNKQGRTTGVRVTVRVLDAGDPVAGATVTGLPGGPKTADASGSVAVIVPAGKKGTLVLTAAEPGYVGAKAKASL